MLSAKCFSPPELVTSTVLAVWCSGASCLVVAFVWLMFSYSTREECVLAQTLLLQLLQSCFSVLTGDNKTAKHKETSQSKTSGHTEAAEELYRHLCEGNLY